jgi:hypothetical protein
MTESLGSITELFSWIGLATGAFFGVLWLIGRMLRGGWTETDAVVVDTEGGPLLRWLGQDGVVHDRPLEHWEQTDLAGADHCRVVARHDRARLASAPPPERAFGVLAIVFFGVGALALAVQLALVLFGP